MFVGIILSLVGWINQDYLKVQWRWYTVQRSFAAAHIWPYVLNAGVERALKAKDPSKNVRLYWKKIIARKWLYSLPEHF